MSSKWLQRLINRGDNVPYQNGWHGRCPGVSSLFSDYMSICQAKESVCVETYSWIRVLNCISPWLHFSGYSSSRQIFCCTALPCQAVQPTGRCNLQWHSPCRALGQISVLKPKGPQQLWHCKTTYGQLSRRAYGRPEAACMCLTKPVSAPHCCLQLR